MTLAEFDDYLRRIDSTSFQYWCCQDEAPTLSKLDEFVRETGFELPADYREFASSRLSCLHLEVREEIWPRRQGGKFWWFMYGIAVFGIGTDVPEWLDIRVHRKRFEAMGCGDLLPFMQVVNDPKRYCFTRGGEIVHWCGDSTPVTVAESFLEVLIREVHALEDRRDSVVDDGMT